MSNQLPPIGAVVRIVTSKGPVNFIVKDTPIVFSVELEPLTENDLSRIEALYDFHSARIHANTGAPGWLDIELDDPGYGAPEYPYTIVSTPMYRPTIGFSVSIRARLTTDYSVDYTSAKLAQETYLRIAQRILRTPGMMIDLDIDNTPFIVAE